MADEKENCYNFLFIYGDRADRDTFLEKSISRTTGDLDLNTFIKSSRNRRERFRLWGTSFNCYKTYVAAFENYDRIYFLTAFNQYDEQIQIKISEKFPKLKFKLAYIITSTDCIGSYISSVNTSDEILFSSSCKSGEFLKNCDEACDEDTFICDDHDFYLDDPDSDLVELFSVIVDSGHF